MEFPRSHAYPLRSNEEAMAQTQELLERAGKVLIGNYARQPVVFARGEGAYLWDTDGKRYLDLFAGFGGAILGHSHPELVRAATDQAKKLWHVGNTFHTEPQVQFAQRLNRTSFAGQAFFCHSGAEANEAACKLARLRGHDKKRWKMISLNKSFHGRTLAMIAATGNPKVREGFEPEVPGFVRVEAGDFDALLKVVDDETAGIIVEPIQGEGGINLYPNDYIAKIRKLCDERGLTLVFDEVWCCGGRTGKWFGHQYFTDSSGKVIEPDIMTMGKAVGGGLPVGVMYAKPHVAALLVPGKHGCTLGGNPICMAVATTIFDVIEREKLLENANALGEVAVARLKKEPGISKKIAEIRGRGLMIGIEMAEIPEKVVEKGLSRGIILNLTAQKVIRLAPPINITRPQWDQGLDLVIETIAAP
jgi:predicted acetylornithine/succinylornithine family transaminase